MTGITTQVLWEQKATVRKNSPLIFDKNQSGYLYPLSRQPLSIHPIIEMLGNESLNYLLVQSFYKYTNDIAAIETRVVNQAIMSVIHNTLPIEFTPQHKASLLTIMVDESYHAYVAYDAMLQIQTHTQIQPLEFPKIIEIELAIQAIKTKLEPIYHGIFELVAVCIAENTLAKDMMAIQEEETHPFFGMIIHDHMVDEVRHANVFSNLLKYIWEVIPYNYKYHIGTRLPEFLSLYLSASTQIMFDKKVLKHLGLNALEVDKIIDETYTNIHIMRHHPMLKNILHLLSRTGVLLEDEIAYPFKAKNWL